MVTLYDKWGKPLEGGVTEKTTIDFGCSDGLNPKVTAICPEFIKGLSLGKGVAETFEAHFFQLLKHRLGIIPLTVDEVLEHCVIQPDDAGRQMWYWDSVPILALVWDFERNMLDFYHPQE